MPQLTTADLMKPETYAMQVTVRRWNGAKFLEPETAKAVWLTGGPPQLAVLLGDVDAAANAGSEITDADGFVWIVRATKRLDAERGKLANYFLRPRE